MLSKHGYFYLLLISSIWSLYNFLKIHKKVTHPSNISATILYTSTRVLLLSENTYNVSQYFVHGSERRSYILLSNFATFSFLLTNESSSFHDISLPLGRNMLKSSRKCPYVPQKTSKFFGLFLQPFCNFANFLNARFKLFISSSPTSFIGTHFQKQHLL